ncbi:hypothetical protein VTK26DRAFT_4856 [Humicola hyalothermophila]
MRRVHSPGTMQVMHCLKELQAGSSTRGGFPSAMSLQNFSHKTSRFSDSNNLIFSFASNHQTFGVIVPSRTSRSVLKYHNHIQADAESRGLLDRGGPLIDSDQGRARSCLSLVRWFFESFARVWTRLCGWRVTPTSHEGDDDPLATPDTRFCLQGSL